MFDISSSSVSTEFDERSDKMNEKEMRKNIEQSKEIEKAVRKCGYEINGVQGYALDAKEFWKLFQETGCLEDDLLDIVEQVHLLKAAMCQVMIWSGKWYSYQEHGDPMKLVDIHGEWYLFFPEGAFQDCYGETDLERALTSWAMGMSSYPISEFARESHFEFSPREEYLSHVDQATIKQFWGSEEVPEISSSVLPWCLQEDGPKVLALELEGCEPCEVVDTAFQVLKDEFRDVGFFSMKLDEQELNGLVERFNVFVAPTLFFSDGKNILCYMGGSLDLEVQIGFIRSILEVMDEIWYDPFIKKGGVPLESGCIYLDMKVIV